LRLGVRALARLLVMASLAAEIAACGSTPPVTPAPLRSTAPSPSLSSARSPSPAAPSTGGSSPAAAGSTAPSGGIVADASLLDLLPAAAAGLNLTYDAETTASVMNDPNLARDAAAVATGLAIPAGQAPAEEFVIVNAVRLRDPTKDEDWFRAWRDSYDAAACAQAGGVTGHAESVIQGRNVFIGSCANGVFTYHTRIGGGGTVLSLTSIGPSRLGEKLLEQIAP
jgi:hypothetical protein